jgi:hypothetical protein
MPLPTRKGESNIVEVVRCAAIRSSLSPSFLPTGYCPPGLPQVAATAVCYSWSSFEPSAHSRFLTYIGNWDYKTTHTQCIAFKCCNEGIVLVNDIALDE